jgi:all-trans-retinol 13,14-reductase
MPVYDVVIIGSGIGGLESAVMLSKEGMKVCVLEKNRQFGGSLQIFVRDKTIFDTGIHYIGGLAEGQNLNQCFKYFGIMDKLKLHRLDMNGFDRITFDNDPNEYFHSQGHENFVVQLSKQFPGEEKNLRNYIKSLKEVCDYFPLYNLKPGNAPILGTKYLDVNARDFIASITPNKLLRSVLGGSNPLYAGNGDKTPLYVHALVVNTYIDSAWKCVDGGSQIERYMTKNIRANGGEVRNYAEVKKIVEKNGMITHVELADGEQIEGKHFISNIHPALTLDMLDSNAIKKVYRKRVQKLSNHVSTFNVEIVLKPDTFKHRDHNYYHFKDHNIWQAVDTEGDRWPSTYFVFVPRSSRSDTYAENLTIMTYMKYSEVEKWADTFATVPRFNESRGEEYEAFKKERAERLLDEAEKKFPGIRNCIQSYSTSTPLTYRDYIGVKDGGLYGIAKDYKNPYMTFIAPKTKIPNLYFTGQNLNMHGVLGVTISAIRTCAELVGQEYLVDKINKA